MKATNICSIACILLFQFGYSTSAAAQNISGDTVFVSSKNQTWLTFKSSPKAQITKGAEDFAVGTSGKNVSLHPLSSNIATTVLEVQEGGRIHNFTVVYKPSINPAEASYNFSDLNKIEKSNKEKLSAASNNKPSVAPAQVGAETSEKVYVSETLPDKEPEKKLPVKDKSPKKQVEKVAANDEEKPPSPFEKAMAKGNLAIGDKNYAEALQSYKEAQRIKPADPFVVKQIMYIQDLLAKDSLSKSDKKRQEEVKVNEQERLKTFNQGMAAYTRYERAAETGNYEEQIQNLKDFLRLIDVKELNNYQANSPVKIEFAKTKVRQIRLYLARTKGETYQAEEVPYFQQELQSKYSTINFSDPPAGQLFSADSATENTLISKEMLKNKPALTISETNGKITLTCQQINRKVNYVYLKINILNNDDNDFVAGNMQLTSTKNKKNTLFLPVYISAFPVVLSGKEFTIVYATKDFTVKDNDNLSFEINHRVSNKKVKINIEGKFFNGKQ